MAEKNIYILTVKKGAVLSSCEGKWSDKVASDAKLPPDLAHECRSPDGTQFIVQGLYTSDIETQI